MNNDHILHIFSLNLNAKSMTTFTFGIILNVLYKTMIRN